MSRAFVREHYQITLPIEIRKELPIDIGDPVEIYVNKDGEVTIRLLKTIDASQAWFWTKQWQQKEKEAEADYKAGRYKTAKNVKEFLKKLRHED